MTGRNEIGEDLGQFLAECAVPKLALVVNAIADAAVPLNGIIRSGALDGALGATKDTANHDGDMQKALDVIADERFVASLQAAGVAAVVSEERDVPVELNADGATVVAIDPLDGSSNIDTNVSIGTIFSIFARDPGTNLEASFLQAGSRQLAAGFVIYGPQTSLVFTCGEGTHIATLDPATSRFVVTRRSVMIQEGSSEFAINASNYRHWHKPVQAYIDDCIEGAEGPRGKNFNMRWIASLVADAYRIFIRGGVFLYPADQRKGYERGRLRHLYEANPIAFLIEQAGGMATDGVNRILDVVPHAIHDRIPFVFGSQDKVARIRSYHVEDNIDAASSPLFGRRGLLRY